MPRIGLAEGYTACPNRFTPPWLPLLLIWSALNTTLLLFGLSAQAQITLPLEKVTTPTIQFAFVTPSVSIQDSFTISYGQTGVMVCANVEPLGEFGQVSFVSDPVGALDIKPTLLNCTSGNFNGNATLTVASLSNLPNSLCSDRNNIKALLRLGQPAADHAGKPSVSVGNITLPDIDVSAPTGITATTYPQGPVIDYETCYSHGYTDPHGVPGGFGIWTLTPQSSKDGSVRFPAVNTTESVVQHQLPENVQWQTEDTIGTASAYTRSDGTLIDRVGICGFPVIKPPATIINEQTITVGKCPLPLIYQGMHLDANNSYWTSRSDPNAVSAVITSIQERSTSPTIP
jgi:hypothetical protein